MGINWDAAAYLGSIARHEMGWSHLPWNSHLSTGHAYFVGAALVKPFGGTVIQGARLMNALALASAAGALALAAYRITGVVAVALLTPALFWASWGESWLVFTLEDNVLYAGFAAGALCLATLRLGARWRARDSLAAGALVAGGWLMSWQAASYLVAPVLAAAAGPRAWLVRGRDVALVLAGFAGAVALWVGGVAATTSLSLAQLVTTVTSKPTPSFFPEGLGGWLALFGQLKTVFEHAGTGVAHELGPVLLAGPRRRCSVCSAPGCWAAR